MEFCKRVGLGTQTMEQYVWPELFKVVNKLMDDHAKVVNEGAVVSPDAEKPDFEAMELEDLKAYIKANGGTFHPATGEKKLIVTDGVFSMDGDLAPLPGIVELAEAYSAMVMVDDAHGEGVLGSHGRGIVDHFDLHGRVDIEAGTMSKAFGVMGGYIAGSSEIIEYLRQQARPFLFSSASTPPDVAACIAAIDILQETDEPVRKLWQNADYFKRQMGELGFNLGGSETPITPVMFGEEELAWDVSKRLFEEGVFATAIAFPTVPRGKARLRVMLSAAHSKEDLDFAIEKFSEVGKEMEAIA